MGARERTTPDRPLIRSDRGERNAPARQPDAPRAEPRIRSDDTSARPGTAPGLRQGSREAGPQEIRRAPERGRNLPAYLGGDAAQQPAERRAVPRGEYGRPATESAPAPRADRPGLRQGYGEASPGVRQGSGDTRAPGGSDRRQPVADRPSDPSPSRPSPPSSAQPSQPARPERSGPPSSAAPPSGGRGRPAGGDAPSRGTAVRRPGGGD